MDIKNQNSLWTKAQLLVAMSASILTKNECLNKPYRRMVIDSREVKPNDVFVALKGQHVDGHHFIQDAIAQGASMVVVETPYKDVTKGVVQAVVPDTKQALIQATKVWRNAYQGPVLAITGSMGKTSTRNILAAMAEAIGERVLVSDRNFNTEIGLPLVLLNASEMPTMVIVEMGARRVGDIQLLCDIAKPTGGVITNIANAHVEVFGSIEKIVEAKSELYEDLMTRQGTGIALNQDETRLYSKWQPRFAACVTFSSTHPEADFSVQDIICYDNASQAKMKTPKGLYKATLPLIGAHQWQNVMAAMALLYTHNQAIDKQIQGLAQVTLPKQRAACYSLPHGLTVYDDSYNAIEGAVRAAIEFLRTRVGHRWLILSDLAELGGSAQSIHQALGAYASEQGIHRLWTLGKLSREANDAFQGSDKQHFETLSDLKVAFQSMVHDTTGYCWIKGANTWHLGPELIEFLTLDTLAQSQ